jgi:hypothetical protein
LLTHLPSFLHSIRAIREWIGPCGSSRTVLFVPPPVDPNNSDGKDMLTELTDTNINIAAADSEQDTSSITALVTLSHADAAAKLMAAFRHFQQKLSEEEEAAAEPEQSTTQDGSMPIQMQAYLVPNNPDIPLKPVTMDPETAQVLGDKLLASYQTLSVQPAVGSSSMPAAAEPTTTTTTTTAVAPMDIAPKPVEKSGLDDNEDNHDDPDDDDQQDPLTTPVVLSAVRDFRRRLERQQGGKSTKRQEAVALKLQELLPVVTQRVQEEASRPASSVQPVPSGQMLAAPLGGAPPPPPPPPTPTGNPPLPTPSAAENAPRGVSNLPAWMTKPGGPAPADNSAATTGATTEPEPPAKRPRLTVHVPSLEGNTDQKFPALEYAVWSLVKEAIAAQCVQSLGEPVPTLVDFIYRHVTEQSLVSVVLLEVQEVLEDEAAPFVQALWEKVHELAAA